ncbi:8192_t:CDS:10 [Ambispora leptoticha]|uniref:8192_t:CDS:1 n=1 Tax=Ambispora leptoticha TaxID=144679 RepID=A0A9N8WFM3_9GLOM|nr:8192_t:CDS:10 [Ambispora leptoticha]
MVNKRINNYGNRQTNVNRERNNNAQEESSRGRGRGRGGRGSRGGGSRGGAQRINTTVSHEEATRRENNQKELMNKNFVSSSLSLEDSEAILPMKHGEELKDYWRKAIHRPLTTQRHIRQFIGSCIIAADQKDVEIDDLVVKLGMDEGLDRIREILKFPVSADAGTFPKLASFQRVTLLFFALLTRKAIARCTFERQLNAIFSLLYVNYDDFIVEQVMTVFEELLRRKSLEDQSMPSEKILETESDSIVVASFYQPFMLIGKLLKELLRRFKEASVNESVQRTVQRLDSARLIWEESIQKNENVYNDSLASQEDKHYALEILENDFTYLKKMLNINPIKDEKKEKKPPRKSVLRAGMIAYQKARFDPPGNLSEHGPRHDNDFENISEISIIPTQNEIISDTRDPFLPFCDPNLPHFLPAGIERLLDTNFRLLREDMLNPIRLGIKNFLEYLSKNEKKEGKKSRFENGRFKYDTGMDNGDLIVYSNVRFIDIIVDHRRGFSTRVSFAAPKIRGAKSKRDRKEYWSKAKKLMNGSMVCLLWPTVTELDANVDDKKFTHKLFFGTVIDRDEDRLAKNENWVEIDINFIDPSIYPLMLEDISKKDYSNPNIATGKYIVESTGVYLESYYHVLKRLQTTNPSEFPFEKYLTPIESDETHNQFISPPLYARAPQHEFILSRTKRCNHVPSPISLKVNDIKSQEQCIEQLKAAGHVDETQAKSIVESLSREIALIEGPPGTGKSYVGVEIVEILLTNKIYPILVICYTNHALDQFLEDILDRGIEKMVRLGSRSKSERIQQFSIEEIARSSARSPSARHLLYLAYKDLESIEEKIDDVKKRLMRPNLYWNDVKQILYTDYPNLYRQFIEKNKEFDDGWDKNVKNSFDYWTQYHDIKLGERMKEGIINKIDTNNVAHNNIYDLLISDDTDDDIENMNNEEEIYWKNWEPPQGNRDIDELLHAVDLWQMSKDERKKILKHLKVQIFNDSIEILQDFQTRHEEKRKELESIYDETRRQILESNQIIGMTTSGAAKFQSIIASIGPRVIICEEAGEVLESHILSSLTPATQHLIMIGDHLQLRPHIATYYLDMDSDVGKNYQLNKSLFERLVHGDNAMKLPMSQLTTQRRMRPEIAELVRKTLYPALQDAPTTTKYPKVSGVQHNVFFLDHHHPEDKSGSNQLAMQSHSNTDALKRSHMTVVIDERDEQAIEDLDDEENGNENDEDNKKFTKMNTYAAKRSLQQQVILRTVDNFQGEEAKIVIVSLVRNSANVKDVKQANIGFVKSKNRTNVLLSRAKHGMFLLGDAELFHLKSPMWKEVIEILRQRNQVGKEFPVVCEQHPNYKNYISEPEGFGEVSPDGGCMEPCQFQLPCGHQCPYKCHADDREHIGVFCQKPCVKLHVECQHPCQLRCGDECGLCRLKVDNITLQCGHIYSKPLCFEAQKPESLKCHVLVNRKLIHCEHEMNMHCFEDVKTSKCPSVCGEILECGHECRSVCDDCQKRTIRANNVNPELDNVTPMPIKRTNHAKRCQQVCGRNLYCGHTCEKTCHEGQPCPPVCAEPCDWKCVHQGECPLTCGAPCNRLPCNERCEKKLECGHQCPGICGDICPSKEFCPICAADNVKSQVVDLIMQETFEEVDWNEERLVVLNCGHCFTMETMDGIMEIDSFYTSKIKNGKIEWSKTNELPSKHTEVKVCPSCRGGINSRRYGRIIKKSTLNLQTKKFLQKYEKDIETLEDNLENSIRTADQDREKFLNKMVETLKKHNAQEIKKDGLIVKIKDKEEISELTPLNKFIEILEYGIPKSQQALWNRHIKKFIWTYRDLSLTILASKNPPYKKAYEAAVANLYRKKTEAETEDDLERDLLARFEALSFTPNDSIKKFEETLNEVKIRPKVDKKIYLYAFTVIVNIQKALFQESCKVLEKLKPLAGSSWEGWKIFSLRILESTGSHIENIMKVAEETKHNRTYVLAGIQHANLAYQIGKFRVSYSNEITESLVKDIENYCDIIKKKLYSLRIEVSRLNAAHLESQCHETIENLLNDVEELIKAVKARTQITKEEKLAIFRAMKNEFQGSGHWYECPNGHPYSIGDCGGAVVESTCPECGATIGGTGHRLIGDNRQNAEFESLI